LPIARICVQALHRTNRQELGIFLRDELERRYHRLHRVAARRHSNIVMKRAKSTREQDDSCHAWL
jgi:hypothetical protein